MYSFFVVLEVEVRNGAYMGANGLASSYMRATGKIVYFKFCVIYVFMLQFETYGYVCTIFNMLMISNTLM